MNKTILIAAAGILSLCDSIFAYAPSHECVNSRRSLHEQYGCIDESDRMPYNTHYNVYQSAPQRHGFQNYDAPYTFKSETYGDTTYHTYQPQSSRKGFGG
jgi:hypothetical protein